MTDKEKLGQYNDFVINEIAKDFRRIEREESPLFCYGDKDGYTYINLTKERLRDSGYTYENSNFDEYMKLLKKEINNNSFLGNYKNNKIFYTTGVKNICLEEGRINKMLLFFEKDKLKIGYDYEDIYIQRNVFK